MDTVNEQESTGYIIKYLRDNQNIKQFEILDVLSGYLKDMHRQSPCVPYSDDPFFQQNLPVFQEAAHNVCRMGVIRVGVTGIGQNSVIPGRVFSVTMQGRKWLNDNIRNEFLYTSPLHFSENLKTFTDMLGEGFHQRSEEACKAYLSGCYLATCSMAGAATESIWLRIAIEKHPEKEKEILDEYQRANGTTKLYDRVIQGHNNTLLDGFKLAKDLIKYRRNYASHGIFTPISEFDAYDSLSRLIRFCYLVRDNWGKLTSSNS